MCVLSSVACLSRDWFTFNGSCLRMNSDALRTGCGVGRGPKSRICPVIEQVRTVSKNAQSSMESFAGIKISRHCNYGPG